MELNIVWLGDLGFPHGLAATQRIILIFKGIRQYGLNGTVINKIGIHDRKKRLNIETEGTSEEIKYTHASGTPYRPDNFVLRNFLKIWGVVNEISILYRLRKKGQLDAAIIQAEHFKSIVFYRILSWLLGFPLVMNYVELTSSYSTKRGVQHKIDSYLYEKYGFFLIDGIMPISGYLSDIVRSHNPKLPVLRVPIISDFDRFDGIERTMKEKYFLFCGSAIYLEVIIFVLKSFELLETPDEIKLFLVCNGSMSEMNRVMKEIAGNRKCNLIKLYSGIPNNQLTELYANACGLLIPLRPTVQDKARFPHKIGEYLASGNPVVSTEYGEVAAYLKDGESALLARNYDIAEFSEKMKFVIANPEKSREIGREGRKVGLDNFDYRQYGSRIKGFIDLVIAQTAKDLNSSKRL